MAIAKVRDGGTATGASATTKVLSVPAAGHALGNTVFVAVAGTSQPCTGVTDSKGNTYSLATSSGGYETIWASKLTTALVSGDTITSASSVATVWCNSSAEFSGVDATVDKATNKLDASGSFNPTTTTTAATTSANELVFAAFLIGGAIGAFSVAGYTALVVPQNTGVAQGWAYKIVSATGTQAATATIDQFLTSRAVAATFPMTAVAAGPGKPQKYLPLLLS